MAVVGGEGEKANVTSVDLAAAIAPDKGKAPVMDKKILALRERFKKDGGESVFKADLAQSPEDLMVNFDEMRRVLDSERRRVDAEKDPKKHEVLEKRYNRLELRYNIYDKLLNNEGIASMSAMEQQDLINTMAVLPGFAEAASIALGGRLSTEQMMKVLSGKGGGLLNANEKKALGEIITSMANDDRFKNRVSKSLSTLTLGDDDTNKAKQILDLQKELGDEKGKRLLLEGYEKIVGEFEALPDKDQARIAQAGDKVQRLLGNISELYRLEAGEVTSENITKKKAAIDAMIAKEDAKRAGASGAVQASIDTRITALENQSAWFDQAQTLIDSGLFKGDEYKNYIDYKEAKTKGDSVRQEIQKIQEKKIQIDTLESQRGRDAGKYMRKMDVVMSEEMKRYWNEVTIENASKAAEAQAAIKGEEKEAAEKMEIKRVETAQQLLDRFTQLSYLKYEGGEAKGWDDVALKQFVKKDLLSRSPKQLSRDILDRIIRNRGQLPRAYGKEIDAMLKDIGVGGGDPPATARDILNSIDPKEYQKWASEKIPDLMGYARARGYYFDKMQLKPGQAEFLMRAYDAKFFEDAAAAKEKYLRESDKLMGGEFKDFITDGALNWKKVREAVAGKDWTQGVKKLWKLMGILGTAYFFAGGFSSTKAFSIFNPSTIAPFLQDGAETALNTGLQGVNAVAATARAVSRTSAAASQAITGNMVNGVANTGIQGAANWVADKLPKNLTPSP